MSTRPTWFAVVFGDLGYALDTYPEERASYFCELGSNIVGEYETQEAAEEAVKAKLRQGADHRFK